MILDPSCVHHSFYFEAYVHPLSALSFMLMVPVLAHIVFVELSSPKSDLENRVLLSVTQAESQSHETVGLAENLR